MRVIAGTLKGRRLKSPSWEGLRPTSDKLRETLFNVLAARIAGARVLDVYAGTGAIGIEALSRGAAHVTFVESDRRARVLIAANLALCGIETGYTMLPVSAAKAFQMLATSASVVPFDLILLDPPYDQSPAESLADVDRLLAPGGCVILEHAKRMAAPAHHGELRRSRDLASGDSALAFYTCQH
jgi:16S rRNA (guanine(966)-N(2))-methyltransferase RsmD